MIYAIKLLHNFVLIHVLSNYLSNLTVQMIDF